MQDACEAREELVCRLCAHAHRREGLHKGGVLPLVVVLGDGDAPRRVGEAEALWALCELPRLALRGGAAGHHLVEGVEVALPLLLVHHAGGLEEVRVDGTAEQRERPGGRRCKREADELAKAGRVVIALRLAVAKRLEDRVGLQDALVQIDGAVGRRRTPRQVSQHDLRRLGLAGATLAAHHDGLRLRDARWQQERAVCRLGDRERMW